MLNLTSYLSSIDSFHYPTFTNNGLHQVQVPRSFNSHVLQKQAACQAIFNGFFPWGPTGPPSCHFLYGPAHSSFNGLPNGLLRWPYVRLPYSLLISLLAKWLPQVPLAPLWRNPAGSPAGLRGRWFLPLIPLLSPSLPGASGLNLAIYPGRGLSAVALYWAL